MFFKKFFVGVVFALSFNASYAQELNVQDKIAKTAQYLCDNVDTRLCGINDPYINFRAYNKKIYNEIVNDKLNTMEASLPYDVKSALDNIENITTIYNMRDTQITK